MKFGPHPWGKEGKPRRSGGNKAKRFSVPRYKERQPQEKGGGRQGGPGGIG